MSATQVEGKEERNVSGGIGKRIMRGITKFLLLVLVPIIAAAAIIGVSLQLIGVPVWQTTLGYLQGQSGQAPPSALAQEEAALSQAKTDNANLKKQIALLSADMKKEKSQVTALQTQLQKADKQLQGKQTAIQTAKQEASIVGQMDAQSAASVLLKLPSSEAGLVVASLSPSAASKVLGAMDPASAAKLLQLAGASDANAVGGNSTG